MGNNNPLQLEPLRVGLLPTGPVGNVASFVRPADATTVGGFQNSPLSFAYVSQVGGGGSTFQREVIESRAATLQSHWLGDHLVTMFGLRRDADYNDGRPVGFVANPADPNDPGKVYTGLADLDLPNRPPLVLAQTVMSYSVVVRWPQRLIKLPRGVDFSVFYNNSENFTPGVRTTTWGTPLPAPQGLTEEYGFNFSAFNDKLTIRVNRYKNVSQGLFAGAAGAPAAINNLTLDAIVRWSVEGNVNPHLAALRNADIALLKTVFPNQSQKTFLTADDADVADKGRTSSDHLRHPRNPRSTSGSRRLKSSQT